MNPKIYCIKNGVSSAEFIRRMQTKFPKYSKAAHCMASNPARYGVALTPAASRHVTGRKENRSLPCRVSFRCSPLTLERLTRCRELLGFGTYQETMLFIVTWFLREMEKAAPTGGTVEAADTNIARTV